MVREAVVIWYSVVCLPAPLSVTCSCEVLMDTSRSHISLHVAAGRRKLRYDRGTIVLQEGKLTSRHH